MKIPLSIAKPKGHFSRELQNQDDFRSCVRRSCSHSARGHRASAVRSPTDCCLSALSHVRFASTLHRSGVFHSAQSWSLTLSSVRVCVLSVNDVLQLWCRGARRLRFHCVHGKYRVLIAVQLSLCGLTPNQVIWGVPKKWMTPCALAHATYHDPRCRRFRRSFAPAP